MNLSRIYKDYDCIASTYSAMAVKLDLQIVRCILWDYILSVY
jgi:hypothetical protein